MSGPATENRGRTARHPRTAIAALLSATLLGTGCALPGDLISGTGDTTTTGSTTPIETIPVTTTSPVSPTALAVRADVSSRTDLAPDVRAFVDNATDQRLDEVGRLSCEGLSPGLDAAQFGARSVTVRDQLTPEERQRLNLGEFSQLFEILAGVHCPDLVPADISATTTTTAPATTTTTAPTDDTGG
ncbi:MAG: hypothetical protein ACK5PP_16345, partial [Acidimicrobiales bacterium]